MKELKCESCGGILDIDDDKEFGICGYCKTKYKLNDNKTIDFKMDDNTKETINKGISTVGKISLAVILPKIIIFIIVLITFIFCAVFVGKQIKSQFTDNKLPNLIDNNEINDNKINENEIKDEFYGMLDEFEINAFNSKYELYSGSEKGSNVNLLIDKVVLNNKKNTDKLITIIYNGVTTTNSDEIKNLKSSIDEFSDYEVILDYGENKLVNKITIENR